MRLEWRSPVDLTPNPDNPRSHPSVQREALTTSLDEVGWIAPLVLNERTGRLIDGHLRRQEAMERQLDSVPVIVLDLPEEDEKLALASIDRIVGLARENRTASVALRDIMEVRNSRLADLLFNVPGESPVDSPDPEAGTTRVDDSAAYPIGLIPGERFDYVVLVFKTELDWAVAQDFFELERVREPFHHTSVGLGRVVDGGKFLRRHTGRGS